VRSTRQFTRSEAAEEGVKQAMSRLMRVTRTRAFNMVVSGGKRVGWSVVARKACRSRARRRSLGARLATGRPRSGSVGLGSVRGPLRVAHRHNRAHQIFTRKIELARPCVSPWLRVNAPHSIATNGNGLGKNFAIWKVPGSPVRCGFTSRHRLGTRPDSFAVREARLSTPGWLHHCTSSSLVPMSW
jgi:hypothetical protein